MSTDPGGGDGGGPQGKDGEMRLPMAGSGRGAASSPGSDPHRGGAGGPPDEGVSTSSGPPLAVPDRSGLPEASSVSSLRLVGTLGVAGAVAGLVIVLVFQWAQPRIEAHRARVLQEAITEVLGAPERVETAFLVDGDFTVEPPPTADTATLERIWVGYDGAGRAKGVAVVGAQPGFQDVIRLIFGYDPDTDRVVGMKVLESKETPGLGDKIEKDSSFVAEFDGVETPLVGVKPARATGAENEVDVITGATISSEVIIEIINNRLTDLGHPLEALWGRGAVARGQPAGPESVPGVARGSGTPVAEAGAGAGEAP